MIDNEVVVCLAGESSKWLQAEFLCQLEEVFDSSPTEA